MTAKAKAFYDGQSVSPECGARADRGHLFDVVAPAASQFQGGACSTMHRMVALFPGDIW